MNINFGRGYENSDKPTNEPFYVNNCGIYNKVNRKIVCNRPYGRSDYHFIYVMEGFLEIGTKSGLEKVGKGHIIIYEPRAKQYINCDGSSIITSYCYLHFTGTKANEIMTNFNLKTGIYDVGEFDGFTNRCFEIANLMKKKDKLLEIKISGLALTLIAEVHEKISPAKKKRFSEIIVQMENDTPNGRKIEEYAALYNLSYGYFIKLFKAEYGLTPANYRLKLLVDKSKTLLTESDLKISDVASSCGFEDAFYYSKIFKKMVGLSPEKYRKKYK